MGSFLSLQSGGSAGWPRGSKKIQRTSTAFRGSSFSNCGAVNARAARVRWVVFSRLLGRFLLPPTRLLQDLARLADGRISLAWPVIVFSDIKRCQNPHSTQFLQKAKNLQATTSRSAARAARTATDGPRGSRASASSSRRRSRGSLPLLLERQWAKFANAWPTFGLFFNKNCELLRTGDF